MALRPLHVLGVAAVLCSLPAPGSADAIQDCCLRVPHLRQPFLQKLQNRLTSYRIQGPQMGCLREAIVFITKKGRELCVSPDAVWVPELMKKIDAKNWKARANRQGA